MAERKVINFYYAPDFDQSLIPRSKKKASKPTIVRMMLPFSVFCATCGQYMGNGTKFDAVKDDLKDEAYLGVAVFRFTMKCKGCKAPFAIQTDPKNSFYEVSKNGNCTRTYVPWVDDKKKQAAAQGQAEADEAGDAMRALERRTVDTRMEMENEDALAELRELNARTVNVDVERMLAQRQAELAASQAAEAALTADEEALVQAAFKREPIIRRLAPEQAAPTVAAPPTSAAAPPACAPATGTRTPAVVPKPRISVVSVTGQKRKAAPATQAPPAKKKPALVSYGADADADTSSSSSAS